MNGINNALESGTPDELMTYLLKPEALLPRVDPSRPYLYFDNLKKARLDKGQVLTQYHHFLLILFKSFLCLFSVALFILTFSIYFRV